MDVSSHTEISTTPDLINFHVLAVTPVKTDWPRNRSRDTIFATPKTTHRRVEANVRMANASAVQTPDLIDFYTPAITPVKTEWPRNRPRDTIFATPKSTPERIEANTRMDNATTVQDISSPVLICIDDEPAPADESYERQDRRRVVYHEAGAVSDEDRFVTHRKRVG